MSEPQPPASSSRADRLLRPVERPVGYLKRAGIAASYPLHGIWYFLRNKEFYPLFLGRLLPLSIISLIVYLVLFTFTFLPQFALLALFHGWGSGINTVVLVLGEGLVVIQGLFEGFFVDECRVDVFDATLIKESHIDLVAPHRILFHGAPTAVKMLGKPTTPAVFTPWSIVQIVELVVFLPLNFIPVVGMPAFIVITGTRLGKLSHYRWFRLRGLNKKDAEKEIRARSWEYVWFGTVAMILELIPLLSFFFLLTTTAGAGLWAAKIEDNKRQQAVDSLVGEDEEALPPPPPYEDDPI